MKKKMKRKLKIKWGHLFLFVLGICCLFFLGKSILNYPIQNIYVVGNTILSDQEIINLAEISNYPSFFQTGSHSIERKILESPFVVSVHVKKKLLGQVYLEIQEAKVVLVDLDGKAMLSNKKIVEGKELFGTPSLINEVPSEKKKILVEKLSQLNYLVFGLISEIKYAPTNQDLDRFGFYMDDGNLVYITLTKFSRMNYYLDAVGQVSCKRGIFNFDSGNHFSIKESICD